MQTGGMGGGREGGAPDRRTRGLPLLSFLSWDRGEKGDGCRGGGGGGLGREDGGGREASEP